MKLTSTDRIHWMNASPKHMTLPVQLSILLLIWGAVFYPLYPILVATWLEDSNNSHGLLVPFISAFLIWRMLPNLKTIKLCSDPRGLQLLVISLVLYLIAYAGGAAVVARSMIVFAIAGLALYNLGPDLFRRLAFPLFFLLFMVPVPVSLVGLVSLPLQRLATDISRMLISLVSIPVYQEGNMLYFVQTQLEVAEACSGIHSIMALLMLGAVFVYTNPMTRKGGVLLMILTIPIAMIANIVRVTGTGILAHYYGSDVARGFLHDFSGVAVFVFGLFLVLLSYRIIQHFDPVKQRNP